MHWRVVANAGCRERGDLRAAGFSQRTRSLCAALRASTTAWPTRAPRFAAAARAPAGPSERSRAGGSRSARAQSETFILRSKSTLQPGRSLRSRLRGAGGRQKLHNLVSPNLCPVLAVVLGSGSRHVAGILRDYRGMLVLSSRFWGISEPALEAGSGREPAPRLHLSHLLRRHTEHTRTFQRNRNSLKQRFRGVGLPVTKRSRL